LIPHVNKDAFELPDGRPGNTSMGVTPAVGVEGADVVPTDVGDFGIDDEELAVVSPQIA